MKLKVFGIGGALLFSLAATMPLQSAPKQGSKPVKKTKPVKPSSQKQCENHLKQLGLAAFMYYDDNDEHHPDFSTPAKIRSQLIIYTRDETVFRCPLGHVYQGNKSLSNQREKPDADSSKIVLLYEPANAHDGKRNVAFADGHIESLTPAQWEQAKRRSGIH
jgi:prepilin-type processing-associated H-X9-DG protein